MRLVIVLVALAASACVRTDTVQCGDAVCPAGTSCVEVPSGMEMRCVQPAQREACDGRADGAPCTLAGASSATCLAGACFPDLCGDGLVGATEACDDANVASGDGCSSDCRSAEVCGNGIVDPLSLVDGQAQLDELCDDGNTRAHDGCSVCETEVPRWTQVLIDQPTPRAYHGMAFDTLRRELVMFGGADENVDTPSESWVWTGIGWRARVTDIEPPGRASFGVVYDSARDRLVVFGGSDSSFSTPISDLWEWNGASWEERIVTNGPGPRYDHAMVYDSLREVTLMIGGIGDDGATLGYLGDTWTWDGTVWTKLALAPSDALPPRTRAAVAFDPVRGETVLFGGADQTGFPFADTYLFDGARWRRVATTIAPSARTSAAIAWDPTSQRVIMFGGSSTSGALADAWAWDGQSWSPLPGGPPARFGARMGTDYERGGVLMYGGAIAFDASRQDTWWFDGSAWHDETRTYVPQLTDIGAAYDPVTDTIVVFGGTSGTSLLATTRVSRRGVWFDLGSVSGGPAPRMRPSMVYAASLGMVLMWGGINNMGAVVNDGTWGWDGAAWMRLGAPNAPPSRTNDSIAYDEARNQLVMFGGQVSFNGPNAETWVFDGATWMQRMPATSPSARVNAAMGYDPVRGLVLMTGGVAAGAVMSDLWAWDGTTWTEIPQTTRPPAHASALLSWNPSRGRMLMTGGKDINGFAARDAWELADTSWNRVDAPSAPTRTAYAFIGTSTGAIRLSGRDGMDVRAELWRLRWESTAPDEVCESSTDIDGDALAACADPDCERACKGCNDGTCSAAENCHICPADCGACAARCGDETCSQGESVTSCPSDC